MNISVLAWDYMRLQSVVVPAASAPFTSLKKGVHATLPEITLRLASFLV